MPISQTQANKIRDAFQAQKLKIRSVSPNGDMSWQVIEKTHKKPSAATEVLQITLEDKTTITVTHDHRIYQTASYAIPAEYLEEGSEVYTSEGSKTIVSVKRVAHRQYMYDLTVANNHNLILHNSKVLAHNCPDKFYHFRPPEHEGSIGRYNQVFGYIWEDEELLEYLERALDWWNMMPPETEMLCDMDRLVKSKPAWRTAILWGAIIHAATALAFNWVADEFDYSIGGVSLSIEKSSKYESLKSNAESQLQLATEAKQRTTKYMRSLTQPRFGRGVRSAFGPHTGAGILSPRKFV